ncbi:ribonuclease P protein component [Thalassoglobus sp.]|uniref:ribonuclease P protein component n=1 Tax=Thalassoglobus sp. TaxID=2795869 RepID=UPI003AA93DEE
MSDHENPERLKFPKFRRVRSSLEFQRIYSLKQRASNQSLLIFAARNELGWSRIGLSVSKKNGNSIARHRIRRLLKEAFRLEQHRIPAGLDLILIPRPNSKATLQDYRQSIVELSERVEKSLR